MGSELMFVYCRALPVRGPGELPGHTQERNFCRGFIFDGGISFLSTKAFVTKNPRNFFNFHCLAAFQEALLWLKALNNEKKHRTWQGLILNAVNLTLSAGKLPWPGFLSCSSTILSLHSNFCTPLLWIFLHSQPLLPFFPYFLSFTSRKLLQEWLP